MASDDVLDFVSEADFVGCFLASALKDHLDGKKVYFDIVSRDGDLSTTYRNQEGEQPSIVFGVTK